VAAPHGVSHVRKLGLGKRVAGGKNDRTKLSQGRSFPQWSGITEHGLGLWAMLPPPAILVQMALPPFIQTTPWPNLHTT